MGAAKTAKLKMFTSMFIFGTIGLFVRNISLPTSVVAMVRGAIGMMFLLLVVFMQKKEFSWERIFQNLKWLVLSGGFLGFNWILLFEAYRYTTVSTATLCYYMAPILIIMVSPFILKERLTFRKILCVLVALIGMVGISGVIQSGIPSLREGTGILLGLAAAVLYASVVLINKKIQNISVYDKTIVQLGISALLLLPYCLFTVTPERLTFDTKTLVLLLFVGIVHTGVTYFLYFGALEHIPGQSAAIISYIDPVVAVLTSVLVLRETMLITEGIGALLILGAALVSELPGSAPKEG